MRFCLGMIFILTTACSVFAAETAEDPSTQILGKWQFYKYHYQGSERPLPNPNLILTFEFLADGSNVLHWERQGQEGFCERKGSYTITNGQLSDRVTWVNPQNAVECSRDPDMRVGRTAVVPVSFRNSDFWLHLTLSGDVLIYVWKKLESPVLEVNQY